MEDMATARGRSFPASLCDTPNSRILRRPGETGLIKRFESLSAKTSTLDISSEVSDICDKLMKMDLHAEVDLGPLAGRIRALCCSEEDMGKCIESVCMFAVKSKWNGHAFAVFCSIVGDTIDDGAKFRTLLLRKLQLVHKIRNKKYLELDSFLMDVTFFCEIYHHIRIDGKCLKVLSRPVIDYFGMLIDGASRKEVELFVEHFPRCYYSLKESDQSGVDTLVCKLRKQIVCEPSCVIVKAMLLEMFEKALTDFEPFNEDAKILYQSICKPIIRLCE